MAEALNDATTDAAALPTFVLGQAMSRWVKVVLTGEGGDEMFCGYSRYQRHGYPVDGKASPQHSDVVVAALQPRQTTLMSRRVIG